MSAVEGDRPTGAPRPPAPRPIAPKPRTERTSEFEYAELPRLSRRRVAEILGDPLREELAEYLAAKAAEHVTAA